MKTNHTSFPFNLSAPVLLGLLVLPLASPMPVPAQTPAQAQGAKPPSETEAIRQEMRKLQSDYEQRIRDLEKRLEETEMRQRDIQKTAEEVAAVAATNRQALDRQFASLTEVRERVVNLEGDGPMKSRVENVLNNFMDIGGYFRAGYGLNDEGQVQNAWKAPGALSKYRLGNEAENYGELIFGKNWYLKDTLSGKHPEGESDGAAARVQVRPTFLNAYDSGSFDVGLGEAYAQIGHVFEAQPDLKFWGGQRFYRRHDIHLIDFFFWNMSGAGGGVEDLKIGPGKAAVAFLGASSGSFGYPEVGQPEPVNEQGFAKRNLDLRYYDLPFLGGQLEAGAAYTKAEGTRDLSSLSLEDLDGFAVDLVHTRSDFLVKGGVNKLSLQYGYQSGKTFATGFETFTVPTGFILPGGTNLVPGTYILPDLKDSWRFRVTENFVVQPQPWLAIQPVLLYQMTDMGEGFGLQHWFSGGARPVFFLSKYFSVAFEGGADYVDTSLVGSGWLWKLTLAPQIQLARDYFSRPSIRFFATCAGWTDALAGYVGGSAYQDRNYGFTFGAQMESWW